MQEVHTPKAFGTYVKAPHQNLSAVAPAPNSTLRVIAAAPETVQLLRVAAYCRVSTLLESQEGSIASQRRHYRMDIEANPDWELAGIYLEAGVSGTRAEMIFVNSFSSLMKKKLMKRK